MQDIAKKMMSTGQVVTSYVKVVQRLSGGRYEVEDDVGRLQVARAENDSFWPPGVSVVVQNGRITGRASAKIKAMVYEV